VMPFPGANLEPASLAFTGIDPYHPFRLAIPEAEALQNVFQVVRKAIRDNDCKRAILVGHNSSFDLAFLNAAAVRADIKRNPFHPFSTFDTATLGGVAFGQTVLMRATLASGLDWNSSSAHSAAYDAERSADLFCTVCNQFSQVFEQSRRRLAAMGPIEVEADDNSLPAD
jgi:ribonuclease T